MRDTVLFSTVCRNACLAGSKKVVTAGHCLRFCVILSDKFDGTFSACFGTDETPAHRSDRLITISASRPSRVSQRPRSFGKGRCNIVQFIPYDSVKTPFVRRFKLSMTGCWGQSILLAILIAAGIPAHAADGWRPVHIRIAGKEVANRIPSISDGMETYVPLDVLALFGADWHVNDRGDAVLVSLKTPERHGEIALAKPNGAPMVALSDVAKLVDGAVAQPDALAKDGKPIVGTKGDTIYLLARVTGASWDGNGLHVTTSFPVPFHIRSIAEAKPMRGYIDLVGALVADEFKPTALPTEDPRPLKIRTGQNSVDVARIVVDLADGLELKASDSTSNSEIRIVAGVERVPNHVAASSQGTSGGRPSAAVHAHEGSGATGKAIRQADKTDSPKGVAGAGSGNSGTPANVVKGAPAKTRPNMGRPGAGSLASRTFVRPVEVRGISFTTDNDTQFHVEVAMSGRVLPYIHYVPGTTQMVMDIPNALLSLPNPEDAETTCTHRLVRGIHARQEQDSPPMTRIVLDTARVVGYRFDQTNDHIALDLILPRNATGALSDKVIVVDAGHGGSATGALGKGGGVVYEKNVTLAIALKLKECLEACGARVIMTRDRDIDVALTARSGLANDTGADLFVSIHNDSNGSANSASGTSTYYHNQDASSRALATCVQEAVMAVTGLPSRGVLSDTIMYQSGFSVLRDSKMPAVLCEVAYINNVNDRRKLTDEGFQQRVAQAVCDGLRRYVEGTPTAPNPSSSSDTTKPFNDPLPVNPTETGNGREDGK
jgi:N-acetylmuramoyl-L-alanine amidase